MAVGIAGSNEEKAPPFTILRLEPTPAFNLLFSVFKIFHFSAEYFCNALIPEGSNGNGSKYL
jgi:hypothetical protein